MENKDTKTLTAEEVHLKHYNLGRDSENWDKDVCKLNGEKSYPYTINAMKEYAFQSNQALLLELRKELQCEKILSERGGYTAAFDSAIDRAVELIDKKLKG